MTQDAILIRSATVADAPLILELIRALAEYERLTHEVSATEEALRLTLFGAQPYAQALIAECGDAAAGFALYFHNYSTFLAKPGIYLEDLFVRPEQRGKGVGKALLARLAQRAVERGCGRLEWAVLDWNEPAIRFYQSLGAQRLTDWTVNRVTGTALAQLAAGDGISG